MAPPLFPPRTWRALTGALYVFAVAMGNVFGGAEFFMRIIAAGLGLAIPALAKWIWNERTRPKATAGWWLLTPLVLAAAYFFGAAMESSPQMNLEYVLPLSVIVGVCLVHDLSLGPTLMLTSTLLALLLQPVDDWARLPEGHVWIVANSSLFGVVASLLERERLAYRTSPPTPWLWTGVRVGFLGLWTILCVTLREQLQVGGVFSVLGADPRGNEGRFLLLAILIGCVLVAALAFRTRKAKKPEDEAASTNA